MKEITDDSTFEHGAQAASQGVGEEEPCDGLLWIGQSYKEIECCDSQSCASARKPACYVHEAERRGISRKLATVPHWAIPGKTKIFLVHRGKSKNPYQGTIFGYFVLSRIEKMGQLTTPASSPDAGKVPKSSRQGDQGEIAIKVHDGKWISTGASCQVPQGPSSGNGVCRVDPEDEIFTETRSCGLRLSPQSIYAVDSLAATVHDLFCAKLESSGLKEKYHSALTEAERDACVVDGRRLHDDVVKSALADRQSSMEIDSRLADRAELRGDLVVFKEPVRYISHPAASFRSLEHINGEQLLNQIARGEKCPTINLVKTHSCRKNGSLTRSEIEASLSSRLHMSQAASHHFLDALGELTKRELSVRGAFKVPGIGTIKKHISPPKAKPINRKEVVSRLVGSLADDERKAHSVSSAEINRLLNELSTLCHEQSPNRRFRLPHIGTFRSGGHRKPDFVASQALGRGTFMY